MHQTRITGRGLVVRGALLTLLTGCGAFTTSKAPLPVSTDPTSGTPSVAPSGLHLGYVWQANSHNLYPILGVTGSARFGSAVLSSTPTVMNAAAISSAAGEWALVLGQDGSLREMQLPTLASTILATSVASDSTLTFSPSGMAAAITSASTSTMVLVSSIQSKPTVTTLGLPKGAILAGIAVSDAGTVLVGMKPAGSSTVQIGLLSDTRTYNAIGTLQGWGGAAFLPATAGGASTEAAIVADSKSAQLSYIANIGSGSATITGLSTADMVQTPSGIGLSQDGKWAFVADSAKPQVVRISLAPGGPAPTSIACACTPTQMVSLTSTGIYSLGANAPGQPGWVIDTRGEAPRTFFVPALMPVTTTQAAAVSTAQPSGSGSR